MPLALFVICFLLGSIPWGVVISKLFYNRDLREVGSGNIGTTNAFRAMGKVGGSIVFLLDFGKGLLSGFIASTLATSYTPGDQANLQLFLAIALIGCVWGHIFSPWLKFKGGKGIAVAVGCLFFTFGPLGALIELAIFAVLVVATRYVSVGSITSAAACPFISLYYFWGNWPAWLLCSLAALTIIWAHRENIGRLARGEENRIGKRKG